MIMVDEDDELMMVMTNDGNNDGDDNDGKITAQAFDQLLPSAVQRNQMLRWGCFVALGVEIIMISAKKIIIMNHSDNGDPVYSAMNAKYQYQYQPTY